MESVNISKNSKRVIAFLMIISLVIEVFPIGGINPINTAMAAESNEYELMPKPQLINYNEGSFILSTELNVVYERGID